MDQLTQNGQKSAAAADTVSVDAAQVMAVIDKGRPMHEASITIQGMVEACRQTGKSGKVIITMEFDPNGPYKPGETHEMYVAMKVEGRFPKPDANAKLFYTTRKNELVRETPEQDNLGL